MSNGTPVQPSVSDLMARYLGRQADSHHAGLGTFDPTREVLPFEAGPVQAVDPRPAWEGATAVLAFGKTEVHKADCLPPPEWPQLVASQEPAVALAFCAGNYPQLMRDFHVILHGAKLIDLCPTPGRPVVMSGLDDWAVRLASKKQFPAMLLAAGILRLARHFEKAAGFLTVHEKIVPTEWRAAWENERAALAWHSGKADEAYEDWQKQAPSVPVHFNRGMAALFLGKPADARAALTEAVGKLPEAGAWHHLGRLYLALAK